MRLLGRVGAEGLTIPWWMVSGVSRGMVLSVGLMTLTLPGPSSGVSELVFPLRSLKSVLFEGRKEMAW